MYTLLIRIVFVLFFLKKNVCVLFISLNNNYYYIKEL